MAGGSTKALTGIPVSALDVDLGVEPRGRHTRWAATDARFGGRTRRGPMPAGPMPAGETGANRRIQPKLLGIDPGTGAWCGCPGHPPRESSGPAVRRRRRNRPPETLRQNGPRRAGISGKTDRFDAAGPHRRSKGSYPESLRSRDRGGSFPPASRRWMALSPETVIWPRPPCPTIRRHAPPHHATRRVAPPPRRSDGGVRGLCDAGSV